MTYSPSFKSRLRRLEQSVRAKIDIAKEILASRKRWLAMGDAERAAEGRARAEAAVEELAQPRTPGRDSALLRAVLRARARLLPSGAKEVRSSEPPAPEPR